MKTLFGALLLASTLAHGQTLKFDENYSEVVVKDSSKPGIVTDHETAQILLQAESITLSDGRVINLRRTQQDIIKKPSVQDMSRTNTNGSQVIIKIEGSGTGGGG